MQPVDIFMQDDFLLQLFALDTLACSQVLIDRSCCRSSLLFSSLSEVVARHTLSKKLEEDGIKYNLQVCFVIFG